MPDRIISNWNFNPVAQFGERLLLALYGEYKLCEVEWIEPIPYLSVITDSISAGDTLEREMKEVYVGDNEVAQWRMVITTDNFYLVGHYAPKAAPYWTTKHTTGELPPASVYTGIDAVSRLQLTEFYQYKNTTRYMTFLNNGTADGQATIVFFGYVFQINELGTYKNLKDVPKPYVGVPCVARSVAGRRT